MEKRRCTATAKSTGERCRRSPIAGATVCRVHGGSAPQVKLAARQRLAQLVDPSLGVVEQTLTSSDERVAVKTAFGVLDRNGLGPSAKVEIKDLTPDQPLNLSVLSAEELAEFEQLLAKVTGEEPAKPMDLSVLSDAELSRYKAVVEERTAFHELIEARMNGATVPSPSQDAAPVHADGGDELLL